MKLDKQIVAALNTGGLEDEATVDELDRLSVAPDKVYTRMARALHCDDDREELAGRRHEAGLRGA